MDVGLGTSASGTSKAGFAQSKILKQARAGLWETVLCVQELLLCL